MSQKIHILPVNVANKIAAGEVVVRPASVVKELVENSIDAEATKITVEVRESGRALIKVADNGVGMGEPDALRAFARHATSKINEAADLEKISTLGFRGEALPSIASVSWLEMITRQQEEDTAIKICIEGGELRSQKPCSAGRGTQVSVERLFYNTPARRKFLKTPGTEFRHIVNVLQKFILAYPAISFDLIHDGKKVLSTEPERGQENSLATIFGKDFVEKMIILGSQAAGISISGFISDPGQTRQNRSDQYFFINRRPVRSIGLSWALQNGYGKLIPSGRYPLAVVFLKLDAAIVDVNVHPSKEEVRIEDEKAVKAVFIRAIRDGIYRASGREVMISPAESGGDRGGARTDAISGAVRAFALRGIGEPAKEKHYHFNSQGSLAAAFKDNAQGTIFEDNKVVDSWKASQISPEKILQIHDSYIILEVEDGFLIIDQHAACERINYEKIKKRYQEKKPAIQALLIPAKIDLGPGRAAVCMENADLFNKLSIKIEPFGRNEYALTEVCEFLPEDTDYNTLLCDIIDFMISEKNHGSQNVEFLDRIYFMMACHASRRAKEKLDREEIVRICNDLLNLDMPFTCPHGRPVAVKTTLAQIEKIFHRT